MNPLPTLGLAAESSATHKQVRSIVPMKDGARVPLNTFCVGPDQNLYMCCGVASTSHGDAKGTLVIATGEGEILRAIDLEFLPQSINFASSGAMFVSGGGKIARLSQAGAVEIVKDAPHIENKEEMLAKLKEAAEEQKKLVTKSYAEQLEQIQSQIQKLEKEAEKADPDDEKGAKRRERRMKLLTQQKTQWEQIVSSVEESYSVGSGEAMLANVMRSSGVAVANQDVFVSVPMVSGYGYSIYRLNHDLEEPKVVVKNVGGCCGQLDIQSDGEHLLIAENTAFQVAIYDREGKKLNSFGKRGRDQQDGFGSCCNPMNVRCCSNGDILTAESSIGDIKRFNQEGEFLGYVGRASVGGGCKHVAIGWDSDRDWHYMMNQDKANIAVLVPLDQAPAETDEERASREAMQGLGKKLIGTWEKVVSPAAKGDADSALQLAELDNYIGQQFAHLEFAFDGAFKASTITDAKPPAAVEAQPTAGSDAQPAAQSSEGSSVLSAIVSVFVGSSSEDSEGTAAQSDALALAMSQRPPATWKALSQQGDLLHFVSVEDGVQSYGATVSWVADDEIQLTWFYGSPESPLPGKLHYKRISTNACGKTCDGEKCDEASLKK